MRLSTTQTAEPAPEVRLTVPAQAEHVPHLRHAVEALARRVGVRDDRRADVRLAVGEACANAVMHAYQGRDPGTLEVAGTVRGRRLEVSVTDRGAGVVPRADSPGLGLGLPLMASTTSAFELRPVAGGGTQVWMAFDLGPAEPLRRVA